MSFKIRMIITFIKQKLVYNRERQTQNRNDTQNIITFVVQTAPVEYRHQTTKLSLIEPGKAN